MFDPTTSHWLQEPQPMKRQPSEAARYLHRWLTITCVSCAAIGVVALAIAYLGMR